MVTIILIPYLADRFGRKVIVIVNYAIFMLATIGLMLSHDIILIYVYIAIAGATYGGRVVVSINYLLEFILAKNKEMTTFIKMLVGSSIIIIWVFIF